VIEDSGGRDVQGWYGCYVECGQGWETELLVRGTADNVPLGEIVGPCCAQAGIECGRKGRCVNAGAKVGRVTSFNSQDRNRGFKKDRVVGKVF